MTATPHAGAWRTFVPVSLVAASVLVLFSLASPVSAFAETHRGFTGSFGSEGTEAGKLTEPAGVAVNQATGDVYVVDKGNSRIDEFEADGSFIRAWGWGVAEGIAAKEEFQTCSLTCFKGIAGTGPGQFSSPEAVAVDNSGSAGDPSKEDVYVTDTANRVVEKFSATGAYLGQIATGSGGAAFRGVAGVGVDSGGVVWVYVGIPGEAGGFGTGEIDSYSDALVNAFESEIPSETLGYVVEPGFAVDSVGGEHYFYVGYAESHRVAKLNGSGEMIAEVGGEHVSALAADPSNHDVYINIGTVVEVFSAAVAPLETFGPLHPVSGAGMAVDSATGTVYAGDTAANAVDVFTSGETPKEAPTTETASEVTPASATLHGELNPGGATGPLEYQFDYNLGASCVGGQSVPALRAEKSEAKQALVKEAAMSLQPNAEYTYCLVAFNPFGSTQGNEVHFSTLAAPPAIVGESAPAPKSTEAVLAAMINPNNQETKYAFEYATNEALTENRVTVPEVEPPLSGFNTEGDPVRVATTVPLTPETVYFYRVIATNAKSEETKGKAGHFTTGPPAKPEVLKPEPVSTTTAVLKGVLNPEQSGDAGTYEFLYREDPAECRGAGEEATVARPATGEKGEPATAEITGLLPSATYTVCLRARDEAGDESPLSTALTFTTLPAKPALAAESTSNLTGTSAVLNATVDPEGVPVQSCVFEYGTSTEYGHSEPCTHPDATEIGSGRTPISISQHIEPLDENRTYHWRVLATNVAGTATGVDHTFVYDTSGEGLPDHRAYEMVTPPHKNGALIGDVSFLGLKPSIAADGSRVIAPAIQCFAASESCDATQGDAVGSPYEFARTPGGWTTTALAPPASRYTQSTTWAYDASTDAALFSMPAPAGQGEDHLYVRDPASGEYRDLGPDTPPAAGIKGPVGGKTSDMEQVATADFSHFAWDAPEPWPPFEESHAGQRVYEYAGLANARPLQAGVSGPHESSSLISACDTTLGPPNGFPPGIMSGDGRTVFFTAFGPCLGTGENAGKKVPADIVYARVDGELADAHTVAISEPSPSECGEGTEPKEVSCQEAAAHPANAGFAGASADGSKAFFLATQQLTAQASEDASGDNAAAGNGCGLATGPNGCNLYEYDLANPEREKLVDVSAGDSSGKGPRVQGVMALSPDASHVYFIAKGVLSTAANDRGQTAQAGADNLYVFERDATFPAGHTAFIAGLPSTDEEEWAEEPGRPANVTPDGRFLVFVSHGDLTADDTSASGAQQVFRYDAQSGQLNRVSIGNDGYNDNGNRSAPTPCNAANDCSEEARLARSARTARSDPSMSNDGSRVFFESPVGLAPHALDDTVIRSEEGETNYAENVYEWEQEGAGSCPKGRSAGCVFLISDGRDVSVNYGGVSVCTISSVCLLGADEQGQNVFFATSDQLRRADTNTEVDYYDARVCEAESPCITEPPPPPAPCSEEECHGTPAAQAPPPGGGTLTLNGAGNLTPSPAVKKPLTNAQKLAKALKVCHKDKKKAKRRSCERSAYKKYGPAKKSAHTNRRAGQ